MTTKEKLVRAIEELSDDATIEDAMERLLFLGKSRGALSKRMQERPYPMPR